MREPRVLLPSSDLVKSLMAGRSSPPNFSQQLPRIALGAESVVTKDFCIQSPRYYAEMAEHPYRAGSIAW